MTNSVANPPVEISKHFVLRTPLLPFSEFIAWGEGATAASSPENPERLDTDVFRLRARLRALVERPEVQGALLVASPDLHASLDTWRSMPDTLHGLKIERALVRYLCRMSARPTPFGLFSGVSSGVLGERTKLRLRPRVDYERHTRLDNDYLFEVAERLSATPALRAAVPLSTNSSLYVTAGRIRYVEARVNNGKRSHHLVSVEPTAYLRAAIERATGGASRSVIIAAVANSHGGVDDDEAGLFVDELIDSQVLVTDVSPPVTGLEPIHHIMKRAEVVPETRRVSQVLRRTHALLASIDTEGLRAAPSRYDEVVEVLGSLSTPITRSRLFQVDMVKPVAEATLGKSVVSEIRRGIQALHRMTPASQSPIPRFCEDFLARYGDVEVPLAVALDEEAGVGFDSSQTPAAEAPPLLMGLGFPSAEPSATRGATPASAWLFERLCKTLQSDEHTMTLTEDDVTKLSTVNPRPLPDTFSTAVQVIANGEQAIEGGEFKLVLSGGSGPPGTRISGRFCHASPSIREGMAGYLRDEEAMNPEAVYAEVVHLPAGRVGNVLCRPVLREYEIPYLGVSGAPADRQIPLSDLLVSVRDRRAVLRSKRLGRQVIPRLSTAHVFQGRGLGVYRFLGSLQGQDGEGFGWSWRAFQDAPFLPRVEFGRLILQRARWRIGADQLALVSQSMAGAKAVKTAEALAVLRHRTFLAVQELRNACRLPRWVVLADGDNELTIDLDNALCVDSFAHLIKSRHSAILFECLSSADELVVESPEGRFVHQISVSATCRNPPKPAAHRGASSRGRRSAPDPAWLYLKLYTGTATADDVLTDVVAPFCAEATARGDVAQWFFIRYGDPDWHLRLRLNGDPVRLWGVVMPALRRVTDDAMAGGLIWRATLDSYEPELERYGGPSALGISERIFAADSVAVASLLAGLRGDQGSDARWRLAVVGVDRLLNDLGLTLEEKLELVTAAKDSFEQEFRVGTAFRRQLGTKFRSHRAELTALLDPSSRLGGGSYGAAAALFEARSKLVQPLAAALRAPITAVQHPLVSIASAHAHMHLNRMLRSVARAQELVIYDLLRRYYQSAVARARKAG